MLDIVSRAHLSGGKGIATPSDSDADGLPDIFESEIETEAQLADTDQDGSDDGLELLMGTDPLEKDGIVFSDEDGDGLSDEAEIKFGTSPIAADADRDGLSDPQELLLGFDSNLPDTDNDGVLDSWEVLSAQYRFTNRKWHFGD